MMKIFVALSLLGQIESLRLLNEPKDKFQLDKTIQNQKATSFHGVTRDVFAHMSEAGQRAQCGDWGCVTIPRWFQDLCCAYCLEQDTFQGFADVATATSYGTQDALFGAVLYGEGSGGAEENRRQAATGELKNSLGYQRQAEPAGTSVCHPLHAVKMETNEGKCVKADWRGTNTVTETKYTTVDIAGMSRAKRNEYMVDVQNRMNARAKKWKSASDCFASKTCKGDKSRAKAKEWLDANREDKLEKVLTKLLHNEQGDGMKIGIIKAGGQLSGDPCYKEEVWSKSTDKTVTSFVKFSCITVKGQSKKSMAKTVYKDEICSTVETAETQAGYDYAPGCTDTSTKSAASSNYQNFNDMDCAWNAIQAATNALHHGMVH